MEHTIQVYRGESVNGRTLSECGFVFLFCIRMSVYLSISTNHFLDVIREFNFFYIDTYYSYLYDKLQLD